MSKARPSSGGSPTVGEIGGLGGARLRTLTWTSVSPVGSVLLVHGLGDHAGRYLELAEAMTRAGFAVIAYDQRGHGGSTGKRGHAASFSVFLDDLEAVLTWAREVEGVVHPPFLYGHSMGGLVLLRYLQTRQTAVPGIILSAPWLGLPYTLPRWQELFAMLLRRVAPSLPVPSGLGSHQLTRDPERQRAHAADPMVVRRLSVGLFDSIRAAQSVVLADSGPLGMPALVLVPGADDVVDGAATIRWAQSAGERVEVSELPDFRHEPHQEVGRERVFGLVVNWLGTRSSADHASEV